MPTRLLLLLALAAGPTAGPIQDSPDLAFLVGSWAFREGGLSRTVTFEPLADRPGYRGRTVMDESSRTVSTRRLVPDADLGCWVLTELAGDGTSSTFHGRPVDGGIAFEKVPEGGGALERRVFRLQDEDRLLVEHQARSDASAVWRSRAEPREHVRVDRPGPPSGAGRIAFISNRTGDWEIWTMAPDGSDLVNVTRDGAGDHAPKWVAGGRRIAFRSQRDAEGGGWNRWEVDADGTDAERVPLPEDLWVPDAGTFPQVNPAGTHLVYAAEREGEQDLYVARLDGGGERVLAAAPGLDYRPLWSPDGSRVLFVSERDGDAEVYVVDAEGSNLRRLTESPGIDRYARWSPDGEWIVYASDADSTSLELVVMRADGSDRRRLTDNEAEDGEPSWSPDGRFVVFRSNASGNGEVCIVEVATGEITNLTNDASYDGEPVWSPVAP